MIGLKLKDGVLFAVEKIVTSKLLVPGANKRIASVDTHIGLVGVPRFSFKLCLHILTCICGPNRQPQDWQQTGDI